MLRRSNIYKLLKKKERIYALSIEILDTSTQVNGLLIREEANDEFIVEKFYCNEEIDDFFKTAEPDIPILLNISESGITTRLVEHQPGYLQKILFKADIENFYIFEKRFEEKILISFCRKKTFDHYYNLLKKKNFLILHASLGPGSLLDLLTFSEVKSITNGSYRLTVDSKKSLNLNKLDAPVSEEVVILNEKIPANGTIGLADYFNFKRGNKGILQLEEKLKFNLEELKFKSLFSVAIPILAVIILAGTLIGHFWKQNLYYNLLQNQEDLAQIENQNSKVISLTSELKQKEEILYSSGFKSFGFYSKHIAILTYEVPSAVILSKFEVQPVAEKIKKGEVITVGPDRIIIEGESTNDEMFKDWIRSFEKFSWIKRIEVLDYSRKSDGLNEFVLDIKL